MEFSGVNLTLVPVKETELAMRTNEERLQASTQDIDNSKGSIKGKVELLQGESITYTSAYIGESAQEYQKAYEVLTYRQERIEKRLEGLSGILNVHADTSRSLNEAAACCAGGTE